MDKEKLANYLAALIVAICYILIIIYALTWAISGMLGYQVHHLYVFVFWVIIRLGLSREK